VHWHGIFTSQQKTQIEFPNFYNYFPTFARRSVSSHIHPKMSQAGAFETKLDENKNKIKEKEIESSMIH
jgi:hypothetical protein